MRKKLGWTGLLFATFAVSAGALARPANIAGTVRDSAGVPQLGAVVQIFTTKSEPVTVFTDERGRYSAPGLQPGTYQVKVTANAFLPSLREHVMLRTGANLVVNITLNTLFEAMQLLPVRGRSKEDDDDWKWTLRSMANRPILRVVDQGPLVVVSRAENGEDRTLKARVSFLAGTENGGAGSAADSGTSFQVEKSLFSSSTLSLDGNMGNTLGAPAVLRATYSHQFENGRRPEVSITARRFGVLSGDAQREALQALALSLSDRTRITDFAEIEYGAEYQTIEFLGRSAAFRPHGALDLHFSPNTVVEYRYATSLPNTRAAKGFDSAPADLSESGPRVSLSGFVPRIENAHHQEISVSQRAGNNNFQIAFYSDRIHNTALLGVGNTDDSLNGNILTDPYSQTFTYNGGSLETKGVRAVAQHKFSKELTATLDYSYGGTLGLQNSGALIPASAQATFETLQRHSIAAKLAGRIPRSRTQWLASYKWTQGNNTLTPVDAFNVSAGQSDPYLNVFIRQPLPCAGFLPGQMEALIDLRNLLAQGYVPVLGQDGHTLYLVQSARSVRGGVAFSF